MLKYFKTNIEPLNELMATQLDNLEWLIQPRTMAELMDDDSGDE